MIRTRLMSALYLLGKRRAERTTQAQRDALVAEFEKINCATNAELLALQNDITRLHALDDALEAERGQTRWLN